LELRICREGILYTRNELFLKEGIVEMKLFKALEQAKKGVDAYDNMVSTLTANKYGFGRMDPFHKE